MIAIGKEERQVEIIREVLMEQKLFSMDALFRRINKLNKGGFITQEEIELLLKDTGFEYNTVEANYILKSFDHDGDGVISYWDLVYSTLPHKKIEQLRAHFGAGIGTLPPPPGVVSSNYFNENGQLSDED